MARIPATRSDLAIYAAIVLTQYAAAAGITTVYAMLSHLYRAFDDPRSIGWVVTGYWLVASIVAAIGGRLGDALGRRRVAIVMLFIAACGSLISATAGTLAVVIVGCAMQGTTGVLSPLLIGIAREHLALEKVPLALGIVTAAGTVSAGVAFFVAGYFIDHWSWRGGFFMKVAVVLVAIGALLVLVPRSSNERTSLAGVNVVAGVLFAPAVAGIFIGLQLAATWNWYDTRAWTVLAGSVALLLAWAWHQARQSQPLLDVRALGNRQVLFANLAIGVLAMGGMQHGQVMSLLLQQPVATGIGFGLSATVAGLILLPLNAIALVASPLAGSLSGRYGPRVVAIWGAALGVIGWTAVAAQPHWFGWVLGASVVELFGLSMVLTAAYVAIVQSTPPERTSEAMGIAYVFLNVFIAIGGQSVFLLLATSQARLPGVSGTYPGADAFGMALTFVVIVTLLNVLVACALPSQPSGVHVAAAIRPATAARPRCG